MAENTRILEVKVELDGGDSVKELQSIEEQLISLEKAQRNLSKDNAVEETEKQWRRFDLEETHKDLWLEQLALIWPDVKKSDTIKFHVSDKYDTSFYLNNVFIGKVEGEKFTHAFTMIWLDTNGPYPKMTRQLIGKKRIK